MRFPLRVPLTLVVAVVIALGIACGGTTPSTTDPGSGGSGTGSATPSSPTTETSTAAPTSPSPAPELPPGVPASYPHDVPSADVPPSALVPDGTDVTGTWYGTTSEGEAIVVSWLVPGSDPFRLAQGLAVWRRFAGEGASWRPVYGEAWPKRSGVLGVSAFSADVTGDGSDDALVFALTGGSGACGDYSVIDLAVGRRVFEREVCDTTIEPASPPGLRIREAVFEPNDPHCCPSAFRESVLEYDGAGGWIVVTETVTPAG